jgi:hypothetical protein
VDRAAEASLETLRHRHDAHVVHEPRSRMA